MKAVAVLLALLLAGCHAEPSPLIIHLANTHFVSRDDFGADLRAQNDSIPEADIEARYAAFLDAVERLQNDQAWHLRELIRQHGIRQVFVEGVTEANVAAFRGKAEELADFDFDAVYRRMTADDTEFADRALAIVEMDAFQSHKLQLGAVGQLLMAGDVDVLPLDDEALMDAADPTKNGWQFDGPENAAREAAMVRKLLAGGPVVVAVLGSGHDLADEIKAANPQAEYRRIDVEYGGER